jgi:hypothetical protein
MLTKFVNPLTSQLFTTLNIRQLLEKFKKTYQTIGDLQVFTSGSIPEDKIGSGFCVYRENSANKKSKYKLLYECSLFQLQLFSIHKALEYFKDNRFRNQLFTIYCNRTAI